MECCLEDISETSSLLGGELTKASETWEHQVLVQVSQGGTQLEVSIVIRLLVTDQDAYSLILKVVKDMMPLSVSSTH